MINAQINIMTSKRRKARNGKQTHHLLSRSLLLGGSIGGTATGVLIEVLLGFTTCAERTDAGLPVEVERTEGA